MYYVMIRYCLMSMYVAEINPCLDNPLTTMSKDMNVEKNLNRAIDYAYKHRDIPQAAIARKFIVDRITLNRRLNGTTRSRAHARREQQLLTFAEEQSIADWCIKMTDLGFPCSLTMIKIMAGHILYDRGVIGKPGIHWHQRFFERNPAVELQYIHYLEQVRAKAATPEELHKWYRHLRSTMRHLNILPENI